MCRPNDPVSLLSTPALEQFAKAERSSPVQTKKTDDADLLVSLKSKDQVHQLPVKKRMSSPAASINSADAETNEPAESPKSSAPAAEPAKKRATSIEAAKATDPSKGMEEVSEHDVLCGRGGATNVHPGNRYFRSLINKFRDQYLRSRKIDKPHISRAIVTEIRNRNGRFLKKDEKLGLWFEIGDDLAREKTSQALRQRAPDHRRRLMVEDQKRLHELTTGTKAPSSNPMAVMPPAPSALPSQYLQMPFSQMNSMPGQMNLGMDKSQVEKFSMAMNSSQPDNLAMQLRAVNNNLGGNGNNTMINQNQPSNELLVQYLAVKERQMELQHHLHTLAEMKLKMKLGMM
jgi:hypothetical protein